MGVGVFGPLRLEGVSLSPRERMVLAALVLRAGRTVTTDELAAAVWGDGPPGTWPKQLQAAIGRVRAAIGRDAIETTPDGYTLRVDPDSVDAERFERLAGTARAHLEADDAARALDTADRALVLWRGAPYADLGGWAPAIFEAERLDEVRMELEEVRLAARLRLGDHESSVADAERLVRESPLRERRWAMLATALYRSGRQADALAAIRAAKERLAEELGAEPGAELRELELSVLRHDGSLDLVEAPASPSEACPYRGLRPFGVDDEEDFFGRDADIAAALGRISRSRFLAVSGASGSGKSSLVLAGVVPALQRRGDRVRVMTPADGLDLRIRDGLRGPGRPDVVVVDQFEEMFQPGRGDLDATVQAITDAIAGGTTVVLVVRSDFLDDCATHPDLAPLLVEGVHFLGPMPPVALREAIEQPARRAGLRLEPGLVEVILHDAAGEAGALPHMSHALVETWLRREGATLTVAGYAASGGIPGAIAQSADRLFQSLDPEQRALCRSVLLRMVARAPDGTPVRRRVSVGPLRSDAARQEVLALLAGARLVSAEGDSVAVAHESLATAWPRLRSWLDEDAEGARLLAAVTAGAETWDADGRPDDELLRGGRLLATLDWRQATSPDLTPLEAEYLVASEDRDRDARRLEIERARRDRSQNLRLRTALAVAAVLLVGVVVASAFVALARQDAERSALDREIEALASTSLALQRSDRDLAALLAVELHRRWPEDARALSALWGATTAGDGLIARTRFDHGDRLAGAVIPGERRALLVRDIPETEDEPATTVVSIVDLDDPTRVRDIPIDLAPVETWFWRGVSVSGDGSVAAVQTPSLRGDGTCCMNTMDLIDLVEGTRRSGPTVLDSRTGRTAVLDADGSHLALMHNITSDLIVLDTTSGDVVTTLPGPPEDYADVDGRYTGLALAEDGRILVGGPEGIRFHDPRTFEPAELVPLPEGMNEWAIADLADGTLLVSGLDAFGRVERDTGTVVWRREVVEATCIDLIPYPERGTLLCRDVTGATIEHDLDTGDPTGRSFESLSDWTLTLQAVDDDEFVTIADREGPFLAHWRLDQAPAGAEAIADGRIVVDGFGDGGRLIATAPADWRPGSAAGGLRLWNVTTDEPVGPEAEWLGWADDTHAVLGGADGAVLYDVRTGESVPLPAPEAEGSAVTVVTGGSGPRAFMIDGDRVVPIDPESGESAGAAFEVPGVELTRLGASVAELGDGRRAAVNWFDLDVARMTTVVYDLETGDELERGLYEDGPVIAIGEDEVLSASTSRLTRSGADLEPRSALPASGVAARSLQLTEDGRMLLVDGRDNRFALYALDHGRRLGTPVDAVAQDAQPFPAAFLSLDGERLATNTVDGVAVWDITPEQLAESACRIAGRELTPLEWQAHLGSEPQVETCARTLRAGGASASG